LHPDAGHRNQRNRPLRAHRFRCFPPARQPMRIMAGTKLGIRAESVQPSSVDMRWERTAGNDLLAVSLTPAHHRRQRSPALCDA
jgi:hypothetical protein